MVEITFEPSRHFQIPRRQTVSPVLPGFLPGFHAFLADDDVKAWIGTKPGRDGFCQSPRLLGGPRPRATQGQHLHSLTRDLSCPSSTASPICNPISRPGAGISTNIRN